MDITKRALFVVSVTFLAVAYHFFKDFDTTASINDRIRTTYDGPLSLAENYMVWNITKDDIRVRLANDARTQFISVASTS